MMHIFRFIKALLADIKDVLTSPEWLCVLWDHRFGPAQDTKYGCTYQHCTRCDHTRSWWRQEGTE